MPSPVFTFYEAGSTPDSGTIIDESNKMEFLNANKGMATPILSIDVWNDKGGLLSSDTAVAPRIYATHGDVDNIQPVFDGTTLNGLKSMLEARSCGAYGVAADQQSQWTPISPLSLLTLGNMPSNSKRIIELRVNVPIDAPDLTLKNFLIWISY